MPKPSSHHTSGIPLTPVSSASGSTAATTSRPAALQPPDQHSPNNSEQGSSSDLVHLSKENSRQGTPFSDLPHPSTYGHSQRDTSHGERESGEESSSFDLASNTDMPSDLRPSLEMEHKGSHHQPLLSSDKSRQSYDSESGPGYSESRRGSRFHERDPELDAAKATRKRYTYAGAFLIVSLISFAIQTETAVYVQHNLKWNKAYCML